MDTIRLVHFVTGGNEIKDCKGQFILLIYSKCTPYTL